ncbi:Ankyrin repeat-containing protein BDA1 [Camellia lanceoleosa]|nr:Ankyrin repeat-containing protein BDA1 [Camellia lanceoleosa]
MMSLKPSMGKKLNLDGLSPLHLALQNGHSDTVKRLVALDSELVRVKGRVGVTPLHYAAGGRIAIVKLLVDNAPSITNKQNSEGSTALDIAFDIARNPDLKKLLKRARRSDQKKKYSAAAILNSAEKWFVSVYRIVVSCRKNLTMDMVNLILIVAVLIATATYQAILNLPAEISTDILFSTTNTTTAQKSSRNFTTTTTTTTNASNPLEKVLFSFDGQNFTYEAVLVVEFYLTNTVAFATSIIVIMMVLQVEPYSYLLDASCLVPVRKSFSDMCFVVSTWKLELSFRVWGPNNLFVV